MPILIAQNLTTEDVHLGDLYTKVPKPNLTPCAYEPGILTTFRSSPELMRSPALHKAIAEGKLAIAIQFTQDEIDSEFDIWPGLRAHGTNLNVYDENVLLTATAESLKFQGAGVTATTVGDAVTVTIPGSGSGSNGELLVSADTTGVSTGRVCFLSGAGAAVHGDAAGFASSVLVGAYGGQAGKLVVGGAIPLLFSDSSLTPTPGKLVFLERADAELLNGAAGKVRIAPIVGSGFVVPVGVVMDVDVNYAITKLATVLVTFPGLRITRVGA